ncbi:hypothetical protein [Brachyspira pilosicoli]|uniref:hypothetical protein n=1 Tax=Brachyspira pilosicoli TaxID=52584 RepID=UPI000E184339|nr:hypothetical protein [Brachyspira pilosicoli]MBW5392687.1 hypothetical protein [Brachyspira pilosicoli]SUW01000.1 Uncharacterised protein [Brachyspira pilosicoli]SUW05087.1 Uncharacterised protein [Brachyspira pilosicoli]SUW09058.1 Uncharacterised protein [Brachyspira pilosicoli]
MNNNNQSKVIANRMILTIEIVKDTDNMLEVLSFFKDTIETAEEHFVTYRSNIEIGGNDE